MEGKINTILLSMPWSKCDHVSIQISLLKSFVIKRGFENTHARHYYKDIVPYIGYDAYDNIQFYDLGEWFSCSVLYPEKREKIKEIIKGKMTSHDIDKLFLDIERYLKDLLNDLDDELQYDVYAFSISLVQLNFSLYVAKLIKKKYPKSVIVFGGAPLTFDMARNLIETFDFIDVIVEGEGEETFADLLGALEIGDSLEKIAGISFRDENNLVKHNDFRPLINNLDELPFPDFTDYYEFNLSESRDYKLYSKITVEASRGCFWGECSFCNLNSQWRKTYREKSDQRILEEILYQSEKHQSHHFVFCDSNISNKSSLFKHIEAEKKDFFFYAEVSAHLSRETLVSMREGGVKNIQIGVESFSDGLLKEYNKGVDSLKNVEMLKWCSELGIELFYNIINDFPSATSNMVEETLKTMEFVKYFQPPKNVSFILSYDSKAYHNMPHYNIKNYEVPPEIVAVYPKKIIDVLGPLLLTVVGYFPIKKEQTNVDWNPVKEFVKKWILAFEKNYQRPSLRYYDVIHTLVIENTFGVEKQFLKLSGVKRLLYLYCLDKSYHINQISKDFGLPVKDLISLLEEMVAKKIMYESKKKYFSLAIKAD